MFTGIIESLGTIEKMVKERDNLRIKVRSDISDQLKIDQSVSHDGVCLTVVSSQDGCHEVVAIPETLSKSRLSQWKVGDKVNLERAMVAGARLDGHMVQGHVDGMGTCTDLETLDGSWVLTFSFDKKFSGLIISKGSVSVNGISLTVVDPTGEAFSVAIIPYTFEHTNLSQVVVGDKVNLEFDIIGKYIVENLSRMQLPIPGA